MYAIIGNVSGTDLPRALAELVAATEALRANAAAGLGIGSSDLLALDQLAESPLVARRLAECMNITSGSTTVLVDRLEAAGFVRREPNPADRRSVTIALTPAGEHAQAWVHERMADAVAQAIRDNDADPHQIVAVLSTTAARLRSADSGSRPATRR